VCVLVQSALVQNVVQYANHIMSPFHMSENCLFIGGV